MYTYKYTRGDTIEIPMHTHMHVKIYRHTRGNTSSTLMLDPKI